MKSDEALALSDKARAIYRDHLVRLREEIGTCWVTSRQAETADPDLECALRLIRRNLDQALLNLGLAETDLEHLALMLKRRSTHPSLEAIEAQFKGGCCE